MEWQILLPSYLPNNRILALSCFLSLENKFKNNPEFHTKCQKTINTIGYHIAEDNIAKGHATKTKNENDTNNVKNFLPHHGVAEINSTKVRVVIDAEATHNSTLLNRSLLRGHNLIHN